MANETRRRFLKGTLAASAVALCAPLVSLSKVSAAEKSAAILGKDVLSPAVKEAIAGVYGSADVVKSDAIHMDVPVFAESSRTVPVRVSTTLQGADSITVLVKSNASPLAFTFEVPAGTEAYVGSRVQVDDSSDVIAVVRAGRKLYMNHVDVLIQSVDGCFGSKLN